MSSNNGKLLSMKNVSGLNSIYYFGGHTALFSSFVTFLSYKLVNFTSILVYSFIYVFICFYNCLVCICYTHLNSCSLKISIPYF